MSVTPPMPTMTDDAVPVANPTVVPLVAGRADDIPVLDFGARTLHVLNPTAAALFLSCDGQSSVARIAELLARDYQLEPEGILDDVATGLDGLRDVGLVRHASDGAFASVAGPPVVEGPGGCRYPAVVPCSCGTGIGDMPWEPTLAVPVGDLRVGVRASDPDADAAAREVLAPVADGPTVVEPGAPPKYSLVLAADEVSGVRPPVRSGLFEDQKWLVLSPDHSWLLRWLTHRVAGWRPLSPTEVRLEALGIMGPNGVALVPWTRGGETYYVTDAANQDLELCLAPVIIDTASGAISAGPAGAGRPLTGVVVLGEATKRQAPDDALLPLLTMGDVRPGDDLEAFADAIDRLAHRVPIVEAAPTDAGAVATALVRRR